MVTEGDFLEKHDQMGHRLIWWWYRYHESLDFKLYHERIRLFEDMQINGVCPKDTDSRAIYKKFRRTVCNISYLLPTERRDDTKLESLVKTIFKKRVLFNMKYKEVCNNLYDFTKTIVGEKKHIKVLSKITKIFMQTLLDMRHSMYGVIRDLTKKKTAQDKDKQFISLFQKPYKNNERDYQSFLKR